MILASAPDSFAAEGGAANDLAAAIAETEAPLTPAGTPDAAELLSREECTLANAETAGQELTRQIKIKVGSSCVVSVAEPDTLARSSGKLRRISDKRR